MDLMKYFSWYLITINIVAFMMYGIDKEKAKRGAWRIPESTLIGVALLGGSFGAWAGMKTFHHKTRKMKFRILVPIAIIIWLTLGGFLAERDVVGLTQTDRPKNEYNGTEITLHLKEDTEDEKYGEYLNEYTIRTLIRKYSDYIHYPIKMMVSKHRIKPGDEDKKPEDQEYESYQELEVLNSMIPLWKKNKSELTDEDYNSFGQAFVRGILCNWLVCLAVWMSTGARETVSKIFAIWFCIGLFVISGFEHSIANMYFIPAGIAAAAQSFMYGMPTYSASRNEAAPMTGGIICPPVEAAASTAPANSGL